MLFLSRPMVNSPTSVQFFQTNGTFMMVGGIPLNNIDNNNSTLSYRLF